MPARAEARAGPGQVVVTRTIDASPAVVFEAWTSIEHLAEWWGPTGYSLPSSEFDFRVGGAFCHRMRGPSKGDEWLHGIFLEIVPARKLVFTFAWGGPEIATGPETIVDVTFEAQAGKTKVTLVQGAFESESATRDHTDGWSQTLDRLTVYAASLDRRR
jgi:uncharacterized protein YndB with AHSA1/START domain